MFLNKMGPKLKKLIKLLNINPSKKINMSDNILEYCDSIKYIELIVELEKLSKNKIGNTKLIKFKDIENFLNK